MVNGLQNNAIGMNTLNATLFNANDRKTSLSKAVIIDQGSGKSIPVKASNPQELSNGIIGYLGSNGNQSITVKFTGSDGVEHQIGFSQTANIVRSDAGTGPFAVKNMNYTTDFATHQLKSEIKTVLPPVDQENVLNAVLSDIPEELLTDELISTIKDAIGTTTYNANETIQDMMSSILPKAISKAFCKQTGASSCEVNLDYISTSAKDSDFENSNPISNLPKNIQDIYNNTLKPTNKGGFTAYFGNDNMLHINGKPVDSDISTSKFTSEIINSGVINTYNEKGVLTKSNLGELLSLENGITPEAFQTLILEAIPESDFSLNDAAIIIMASRNMTVLNKENNYSDSDSLTFTKDNKLVLSNQDIQRAFISLSPEFEKLMTAKNEVTGNIVTDDGKIGPESTKSLASSVLFLSNTLNKAFTSSINYELPTQIEDGGGEKSPVDRDYSPEKNKKPRNKNKHNFKKRSREKYRLVHTRGLQHGKIKFGVQTAGRNTKKNGTVDNFTPIKDLEKAALQTTAAAINLVTWPFR